MKKIETFFTKAAHLLNVHAKPSIVTFFIFILCVSLSFLINKTRRKTPEELQEEKLQNEAFKQIFF
jgi:hypothetical protein